MDYEQKYKEALERARDMLSYKEVRREDMEYLFPELKESTDEGIRESIAGFLKTISSLKDGKTLCNEDFDSKVILEWVAWLEKQNELSIKWNKNTEGNKPAVNHSILMKTTHGISEGEWKGGEYWYQYRWSTNHIKDSDVLAWMELSDLDKSFDKIEPKFKVNDWIVINGFNMLITDIYNGSYDTILESDECRIYDIDVIDKDAHLWSINDAKDGDILVTENEKPFIFKGLDISHSDKPITYGGIVDSGYFTPSRDNCTNRWTDGNAYPATKEQRDLLFTKMREVGYEWDAVNKQLKKIEKY